MPPFFCLHGRRYGRSRTSLCSTTLGHPVHRRGRQEKVRPGTGREAGLGHAGSDTLQGSNYPAIAGFPRLAILQAYQPF